MTELVMSCHDEKFLTVRDRNPWPAQNLAILRESQGFLAEAEGLFRQAVAISEQSLGVNLLNQGRMQEARTFLTQATRIASNLWAEGGATIHGQGRKSDLMLLSEGLFLLIALDQEQLRPDLEAAFEAPQWATRDVVGTTADKALAAFAEGSGGLSTLSQERHLAQQALTMADATLVRLSREGTQALLAGPHEHARRLRQTLAALDGQINGRFPAFGDLVHGRPLPLGAAQSLLQQDEALLLMGLFDASAEDEHPWPAYAYLITPDNAVIRTLEHSTEEIEAIVRALRRQLDPGSGGSVDVPFGHGLAHELYQDILGAFADNCMMCIISIWWPLVPLRVCPCTCWWRSLRHKAPRTARPPGWNTASR